MAINGRALTVAGIGAVFVWSGIKGWSVLATIGDLIAGKKPVQATANPLAVIGGGGSSSTGVLGSDVEPSTGLGSIAVQYVGHRYVHGGAPGPDGSRPWDCSSFMNWIVAVKGGKAIPGYAAGKYRGNSHGPTTGQWAVWPGMDTIKRSDLRAGDIILWSGHMGMAISNEMLVSALNERVGTKTGRIDAGVNRGPIVRCGRLR